MAIATTPELLGAAAASTTPDPAASASPTPIPRMEISPSKTALAASSAVKVVCSSSSSAPAPAAAAHHATLHTSNSRRSSDDLDARVLKGEADPKAAAASSAPTSKPASSAAAPAHRGSSCPSPPLWGIAGAKLEKENYLSKAVKTRNSERRSRMKTKKYAKARYSYEYPEGGLNL